MRSKEPSGAGILDKRCRGGQLENEMLRKGVERRGRGAEQEGI